MTATRTSLIPLGLSFTLALITGFFQATFWGFTSISQLSGVAGPEGIAGPVAAVTFIAWLSSVGWAFTSSKKMGWVYVIGIFSCF